MEFDQKTNCDKCGSFRSWVSIKNDSGAEFKRKCRNCEILPVYKYVDYKILNFAGGAEIFTNEYEIEKNRFIILGD